MNYLKVYFNEVLKSKYQYLSNNSKVYFSELLKSKY